MLHANQVGSLRASYVMLALAALNCPRFASLWFGLRACGMGVMPAHRFLVPS